MSHYLSVVTNFQSPSQATVHLHIYRENFCVYIFCIVFIFSGSSWQFLACHIFYQKPRTKPALHCLFRKPKSRITSSSIPLLETKSKHSDSRPWLWLGQSANSFSKDFSKAQIYRIRMRYNSLYVSRFKNAPSTKHYHFAPQFFFEKI